MERSEMMSKARKLRDLMKKEGPIVIAGAHNGISGKLVEEAGFEAIWASGFEISAAHAVPDANILTMSEALEAAKQMNDVTSIPVIADCDNGYGNAINVIRCVEEYEKAGIAAICIEDNIFPKRCSFYAGVKRELVPVDEHAGKIRAAIGARKDPDFVIISRTEALIAGWGKEEALTRCNAYADAGADAVLCHSKNPLSEEVLDFARSWDRDTPLVVVPTIFKSATVTELYEGGYKMIIFANHAMRSSIKAMREALHILRKEEKAESVDDYIVTLPQVYELVGVPDLKCNEKEYLLAGGAQVNAIIIAAGFEKELLPLIEDRPKSMLDIKGRSILDRQIEALNTCNIKDISVVRGYKREMIDLPNLRYYDNEDYEQNFELYSLFEAEKEMNRRFVFLYSDIIFDKSILEKLLQSQGDFVLVVDRAWGDTVPRAATNRDLVITDEPISDGQRFLPGSRESRIHKVGQNLDQEAAHGEFIGMAMFSAKGAEILKQVYKEVGEKYKGQPFQDAESLKKASFTDIIQELIDRNYAVTCCEIYKGWLEIDTFEDYRRAWATVK